MNINHKPQRKFFNFNGKKVTTPTSITIDMDGVIIPTSLSINTKPSNINYNGERHEKNKVRQ